MLLVRLCTLRRGLIGTPMFNRGLVGPDLPSPLSSKRFELRLLLFGLGGSPSVSNRFELRLLLFGLGGLPGSVLERRPEHSVIGFIAPSSPTKRLPEGVRRCAKRFTACSGEVSELLPLPPPPPPSGLGVDGAPSCQVAAPCSCAFGEPAKVGNVTPGGRHEPCRGADCTRP